ARSAMASALPNTFRRLVATKLTHNFREAVEIINCELKPPTAGQVLIKTKYAGVNASDINFTAGRYKHASKPPILLGFEGVGRVVQVGPGVGDGLKVGQPVAYLADGSFSEYQCLSAGSVFPVPSIRPEFVSLLVSGLTAELALEKVGQPSAGETVLVTGAAGGTGQFAVQLAKLRGCRVLGTCSGEAKARLLTALGCDRPIDYTKEKLDEVLKRECPRGVNVVYEGVGGKMFDTAVDALATHGRLIVIGFIQGYQTDQGMPRSQYLATLPARLLVKSASVRGFFLFNFFSELRPAFDKLVKLLEAGQLRAAVDMGRAAGGSGFQGLEAVPDAVQHLYSKSSLGKIVVDLDPDEAKL
ncbi:hypothetical protein BOX15_Mlig020157g3, partial [Macrostomum lignano]